jgi:hypothetical protein
MGVWVQTPIFKSNEQKNKNKSNKCFYKITKRYNTTTNSKNIQNLIINLAKTLFIFIE